MRHQVKFSQKRCPYCGMNKAQLGAEEWCFTWWCKPIKVISPGTLIKLERAWRFEAIEDMIRWFQGRRAQNYQIFINIGHLQYLGHEIKLSGKLKVVQGKVQVFPAFKFLEFLSGVPGSITIDSNLKAGGYKNLICGRSYSRMKLKKPKQFI